MGGQQLFKALFFFTGGWFCPKIFFFSPDKRWVVESGQAGFEKTESHSVDMRSRLFFMPNNKGNTFQYCALGVASEALDITDLENSPA